MLANKIMGMALRNIPRAQFVRLGHSESSLAISRSKVGNREIVGYGWNGEPMYQDRVDYPMPSVRFQETTPQLLALREKEKGDWKTLTTEEKKALYRASFCQTFAEFKHPTGEWKYIVGWSMVGISIAIMVTLWMKAFGEFWSGLALRLSQTVAKSQNES